MGCYADSSFLVSCYLADANTAVAKSWLIRAGVSLPFTPLHQLEVRNAFKPGVFRGLYPPAEAAAAWQNVQRDLRAGRLSKTAVNWLVSFRFAERFSQRYSASLVTRSLDILHVAVAKALRSADFISFDSRQRAMASAVGFRVDP